MTIEVVISEIQPTKLPWQQWSRTFEKQILQQENRVRYIHLAVIICIGGIHARKFCTRCEEVPQDKDRIRKIPRDVAVHVPATEEPDGILSSRPRREA
jgi:hypothetical protein